MTATMSSTAVISNAAPHRNDAARQNRSDSPYQQRTSQKDNPTQQLIKQAVDYLIQQLEAGKSETLTAYLGAMARFHSYSFGNILQIARQRPSATRVAGIRAWNELGRFVKKGEKGIQILAPIICHRRKRDKAEQEQDAKPAPILIGFRAVYVFDLSQTEGADLPEFEHSTTGEVGEHRDRMIGFLAQQNIKLEFNEKIAPALGVSYQHNNVYDADLKYWTSRINGVDIPDAGGQHFLIGKTPLYAGLYQPNRPALNLKFQRFSTFGGFVVDDPKLVFSSKSGQGEAKDANPLHGLVNNRPWDYSVTSTGVSTSGEVAAICPATHARTLELFLCQLSERSDPDQTEREYLQPFPGFAAGFSLPLVHARPGEALWQDLAVSPSGSPLEGAKQIARAICTALDRIRGLNPGAIAVIFVPKTWLVFELVDEGGEHFNLHDFVKAFAARNGQSTQFLREKTVVPIAGCRVKWWLSLALYAKAMRTPWRLDCVDEDSAFVGIGYSEDGHELNNQHILLGCSHIYSASGEGLRFRLGRIENPIIRGRNPYMSLDDARRTGETIRQLFFDARMRLPKRVVIHKRTHFTKEEQDGLTQGLEGVKNVELIEINTEESIRFLASRLEGDKLTIDKFPMPRGAAIVLGDDAALLWVHGHAPSVQNARFKYYQGKRRIPAPLLIKRYRGDSDLEMVSREILGLSKMNWNHFDYYSHLPASLDSASAIARVGTYLSHYGSAPYDYRLLI